MTVGPGSRHTRQILASSPSSVRVVLGFCPVATVARETVTEEDEEDEKDEDDEDDEEDEKDEEDEDDEEDEEDEDEEDEKDAFATSPENAAVPAELESEFEAQVKWERGCTHAGVPAVATGS